MGLNENQKRTVTITLRLLEQRLSEIERAIQTDEVGILYRRHAHFTPTQVEQIRDLIAAMRAEIQRAADEFHLPREEINTARFILGTSGLAWESLEDARPRKLGAYGEVDPELNDILDPILQRLIDHLFDLDETVRRDGRSPRENRT